MRLYQVVWCRWSGWAWPVHVRSEFAGPPGVPGKEKLSPQFGEILETGPVLRKMNYGTSRVLKI